MTAIDLATLDGQMRKEATLEITHPATGVGTGIKITVCSPDSDHYQKLVRRNQNKVLQFMSRNKGSKAIPAELVEENNLDVLVGCVLSWQDVAWGSTALECTEENVRMLYAKLPFIKEQVNEFVGERAHFFNS
jgi:hypothetical protein